MIPDGIPSPYLLYPKSIAFPIFRRKMPLPPRRTEARTPYNEGMQMQVPRQIHHLSQLFRDAGHALYLVGGNVRDALLGRENDDADLATDATPPAIKRIVAK